MSRQRVGVGLAVVLATVLATGMSIDPKQTVSSRVVVIPDPPAAPSDPATAPPLLPPEGYQRYLIAVLEAEALKDPVKRCLAYPELPGNEWPKGMAEGLCALVPEEGSLDELDKVLKQPGGGADLDRRYAALLDLHYAGPKGKDRIFRAYDIFDESPHAAAVAQEWVRQSPDSAYARTARAWQLVDAGWDARGAKFMRETPQDNVRRMQDFFARALPDLDFALKQNPRLLPACTRLISIGKSSSAQLEEIGSNLCLKADPASYRVMGALLAASQPKWGGSQDQMRALVAMARAHEASNPTLGEFRSFQAGYAVGEDTSDDQSASNAQLLEQVSRMSSGHLQDTARVLGNLQRWWDSFVYASQAIRFNPKNADSYYYRGRALRKLHAFELAIDDATRSKAYETTGGWADLELSMSLSALQRYVESRDHALMAMDNIDTREAANELVCRSYWHTHELDKMAECAEKFVVDYPGNDEAWRQRAVAYKDSNSPKVYDAVDDFLARAHSEGQASEITWFKGWRVEHPRPTSNASPASSASKH